MYNDSSKKMITQSLHFEITRQDAERFCRFVKSKILSQWWLLNTFCKNLPKAIKIKLMTNCVPKKMAYLGKY